MKKTKITELKKEAEKNGFDVIIIPDARLGHITWSEKWENLQGHSSYHSFTMPACRVYYKNENNHWHREIITDIDDLVYYQHGFSCLDLTDEN